MKEKLTEKQVRCIAAYAVNIIQNHLKEIEYASYPQPPELHSSYRYFAAHFDNIREMINGKSPQEIKEALVKKYELEDYQRKAMHVSEMSDEDIEAIKNAKVPEGHEHLNELLDEDE